MFYGFLFLSNLIALMRCMCRLPYYSAHLLECVIRSVSFACVRRFSVPVVCCLPYALFALLRRLLVCLLFVGCSQI